MIEYNYMYEYNDEDGGIQFQPYDDELIDEYLIPKLEGKPRNEITMKDVYSTEPWLLDHPMGSFFKKNEWYYFVTRTQLSKKKIGCGKKAKRMITRDDDSGSWRANAKENIPDKDKTMVIGEKQTLAFIKSKVIKKKTQKSGDGTCCDVVVPGSDSSWIMTEYMLPEIEGKFRELVICKIHVIENTNKKKGHDDRHDQASTSSYHHHHHINPSTSEQQPMYIVDHGILLASSLEQQPMNMYHHHIDFSTLVQKPNNIVDHGTFVASLLEQQPMNMYHHHIDSSTLVQQPNNIVNYGTFVASFAEQQPMNMYHHQQANNIVNYGTFVSPFVEQQPMNMYHHQQANNIVNYGTFVATYLEQQPTNIIQESKNDDHEAYIPHHDHESLADFFTKQQPVNEVHGHVPEVPLIGSEKNDQVFEASRQVPEKDEQDYIDAPLVGLGSEQEAEEGGRGWIQGFVNSLMTVNVSNLPMEEDNGTLIYYTSSFVDHDLLDQYATLRPQERSKLQDSEH